MSEPDLNARSRLAELRRQFVAVAREIPYAVADKIDGWIVRVHSEVPGSREIVLADGRHGPFCWACKRWTPWPCRDNALATARIRERELLRRESGLPANHHRADEELTP